MSILSGITAFFGLDIGTTAIRLVELRGSGLTKTLARYAQVPIDSKIALSESKTDRQRVAQAISQLIAEAGVTTRNVAVGIPSQRVFTTVVDFDRLSSAELAKSIHYQADSLMPNSMSESKLDWALLGDSPADKNKVEVLLSSVTNKFIEGQLDLLESIGLNVIAFEPDNLAVTRAMLPPDVAQPAMVLDIGNKNADLVIAMNGMPRLTRSIPTGSESFIRAAMQGLSIDENQANQFVFKFGLSKDKLEGQVYQAIIGSVDLLVAEIEKSIKFFQDRYSGAKVERIIVTGAASVLPEFPLYMANKFGVNVEIGNAWRNVVFPATRQNELLAVSNHYGVAAGLAERTE